MNLPNISQNNDRNILPNLLFFGFIFLCLMAFFTEAHLLVPYDGDD